MGDKCWIVNDNLKCQPWSLEIMAKEMKQKKEVKKPKKHDDKAQDMAMLKSKVKKSCMK